MNSGVQIRLSQKQKEVLCRINEIQPVSTMRLGYGRGNFRTLHALERKGLIGQGKTSLLGRLWSLEDAGKDAYGVLHADLTNLPVPKKSPNSFHLQEF